ncbi:SRPBCC domain-containing protein [Bradyrhizobium sp. CB2312]|uniref:SRPBCC family protein n=1 Tax=Bradyrhizobium sp. CB2312 TaxID=3039155 RepID=UPI0024B1D4D5|nr:SRPBCC domain-containing protein [Bradyrhizobium sp. CB2312]WFU75979.1 SRPBCC domain-containing protein [Bradyrhizobium sp. CB2312]
MNAAALQAETKDIVIDEVLPHAPETVWKVLTNAQLIARWLMQPTGFEAVEGKAFTFQTTPGGNWDGVIQCRVLEVVVNRRLVYAWKGGDARNIGYGAPLDTVVTWSLTPVEAGTRIRLVHAGFDLPRNESAYTVMSGGWKKVVRQLDEISGEK